MDGTREQRLLHTFIELADTLVQDFDIVDFLHLLARRATELLAVAEAGLLLADSGGTLHVMASSSERTASLELFQLQNEEGPCLECYRKKTPVLVADLAAETDRWPRFAAEAGAAGFSSVQALPMRLRDELIGVMNFFGTAPGDLGADDLCAGQAMADIATIGILHQRAVHQTHVIVDQLQGALVSRVVIEQAKGMLAERAGVQMNEAFTTLRNYARSRNRRLVDVAQGLIDGSFELEALSGPHAGESAPEAS